MEQLLADFNSRWEKLCSLLDERKNRLNQATKDQKVSYIIEIITTLEVIIIEAEKELDRMGQIPDDELRIQEQKKIIKVRKSSSLKISLLTFSSCCFFLVIC